MRQHTSYSKMNEDGAMIELTVSNNDRVNYESVDMSPNYNDSNHGQGGVDDANPANSDEERVALAARAQEDSASVGAIAVHARYDHRSNQQITAERCLANMLLLSFLVSFSFAFGGIESARLSFLNAGGRDAYQRPDHPSNLTTNSEEPMSISSSEPLPSEILHVCRPPTNTAKVNEFNNTSSGANTRLQEVYHNRFSNASTDGQYRSYMSGDASIMVWTEPLHCRTQNHVESGRIRTFGWDCSTSTYKGMDLGTMHGARPRQHFGTRAQLSDNGHLLLVQSGGGEHTSGEIGIYHWTDRGWTSMLAKDKDTISFDLLCRSIAQDEGNFPIFSMNKEGTGLAVMTEHFVSHVTVAVYRWEREEWIGTTYSMPLLDEHHIFQQRCLSQMGIAISQDTETVTLFSAAFGILRVRLNATEGTIHQLSDIAFQALPDLHQSTQHGDTNYHELYVSVVENTVLYSISRSAKVDDYYRKIVAHGLVEFQDDGWVVLYNKTGNNVAQVALQPQLALFYGDFVDRTLPLIGEQEWQILLQQSLPHNGDTAVIELSGEGSFLSLVYGNGNMFLYSINV